LDVWSLTERRLLGTIVASAQDSWICFTSDGYYKGYAAEKYLAWQVGDEIHPARDYVSIYAKPEAVLASLSMRSVTDFAVTPSVPASSRPPSVPSEAGRGTLVRMHFPNGQLNSVLLYKRSYALLIGNSAYKTWDTLTGVRRDLDAVGAALKGQGFEIVSVNKSKEPVFDQPVLNATREEFNRQIEWFISQYGQDPENRLLIYYAGHGYTARLHDGRIMGYLMMIDAPKLPPVNLERPLSDQFVGPLYRSSVNMGEIQTIAANISARHALFVFDSCFAGTVFLRGRDNGAGVPHYINTDVSEPVREFLTAGNELQVVPDDSKFRPAFVRGIEGAADKADSDHPKDGYVTATELYDYIRQEVIDQTPLFARISTPQLSRGDFVFVYRTSGINK